MPSDIWILILILFLNFLVFYFAEYVYPKIKDKKEHKEFYKDRYIQIR